MTLAFSVDSLASVNSKTMHRPDRPTLEFIESIEAKLVMPQGAHPLSSYVRYYSRKTVGRQTYVVATFIFDGSAGRVQLADEKQVPNWLDGGCDVVKIRYSMSDKRFLSVMCNGLG